MTSLLQQTIGIVVTAGKAVADLYQGTVTVQLKDDRSEVTEADLRSNRIISDRLRQFGWPILSEETEDDQGRLKAERVWILDPLDGTRDFIAKTGEFSVMVGLVERGAPILGVVYAPTTKQCYFAERGQGSYCSTDGGTPERLAVSPVDAIENARLVVTRSHFTENVQNAIDRMGISSIVKMGSNGIKLARIARGEADVNIIATDQTGEWDICGPHIILEEAGGMVTDMRGAPLVYNKETANTPFGAVSTNGHLHNEIIKRLNT